MLPPGLPELTYELSHFAASPSPQSSKTVAQSVAPVPSRDGIDQQGNRGEHFLVPGQAINCMTPTNPGKFYVEILKAPLRTTGH